MNREFEHTGHAIPIRELGDYAPDFKEVFNKYYATLCYFAERITGDKDEAEDVVTNVFLRVWHRTEPFTDYYHLQSFLYKATRNASLDHIKQANRARERQFVFLSEIPESDDTAEVYANELIRAEVLREIYLEIKNLPEQCGKIVSMSYIEGLKNEEIADQLGLSVQTVKNQKSKGISLLKARLTGELFAALLLLNCIR